MNPRDVSAFCLIVIIATLATLWLGPYWFILIVAVLCGVWCFDELRRQSW